MKTQDIKPLNWLLNTVLLSTIGSVGAFVGALFLLSIQESLSKGGVALVFLLPPLFALFAYAFFAYFSRSYKKSVFYLPVSLSGIIGAGIGTLFISHLDFGYVILTTTSTFIFSFVFSFIFSLYFHDRSKILKYSTENNLKSLHRETYEYSTNELCPSCKYEFTYNMIIEPKQKTLEISCPHCHRVYKKRITKKRQKK